MKDKIINKAGELFLGFGFKSVTMDDIANAMGISKKTLYTYFKNKTDLVKEVVMSKLESITCGIDEIIAEEKNPIEEVFEIKQFVMSQLKNEKSSPQFQLQKYYPELFEILKKQQLEKMLSCVESNIQRGISNGIYRDNLNVEFISRLYFNCVQSLKDDSIFPNPPFTKIQLMEDYLEYHLRGIVTPEGFKTLTKFINQKTETT